MAVKGEKGNQAEEFARASWEWTGELARSSNLLTQVSLSPTNRKGVWRVQVRALVHVDDRPMQVATSVGGEWPNSEHVEFWAYVNRLQHALDEQVAEQAKGGWLRT